MNGGTNGFAFCRNSSTKREGGDYNVLRSLKKNIGRLKNIHDWFGVSCCPEVPCLSPAIAEKWL